MIGEFERYHGAAIRELIVCAGRPVEIETFGELGRVNAYCIDNTIGIHLKHSSKRLPPWQFTYHEEHLRCIHRLADRCNSVWLIHVCGQDGLMTLSLNEFRSINPIDVDKTNFIRVDRDRNTMYRVYGTGGKLSHPKRRGIDYIFGGLQD